MKPWFSIDHKKIEQAIKACYLAMDVAVKFTKDKDSRPKIIFAIGNFPVYWNRKGDDLFDCGIKLITINDQKCEPPVSGHNLNLSDLPPPEPGTNDTAIMLICMALECFYKARILQIRKGSADSNIKWGGKTGHNLSQLAKEALIKCLTNEDYQHLEDLSRHITWHGRYPVPSNLGPAIQAIKRKKRISDFEVNTPSNLPIVRDFLIDRINECKRQNQEEEFD